MTVHRCFFVAVATATGLRQRLIGGKAEERDSQHFIRQLQQLHVWLRVAVISHSRLSLPISAAGIKWCFVFRRRTVLGSGQYLTAQTVLMWPQEDTLPAPVGSQPLLPTLTVPLWPDGTRSDCSCPFFPVWMNHIILFFLMLFLIATSIRRRDRPTSNNGVVQSD